MVFFKLNFYFGMTVVFPRMKWSNTLEVTLSNSGDVVHIFINIEKHWKHCECLMRWSSLSCLFTHAKHAGFIFKVFLWFIIHRHWSISPFDLHLLTHFDLFMNNLANSIFMTGLCDSVRAFCIMEIIRPYISKPSLPDPALLTVP